MNNFALLCLFDTKNDCFCNHFCLIACMEYYVNFSRFNITFNSGNQTDDYKIPNQLQFITGLKNKTIYNSTLYAFLTF